MKVNWNLAQYELSAGTSKQLPESTLPEVVFSGRSNVGKSSLLNKLLNRKALARVSATPGKTITINFYRVDGIRFVDFPGYGYAKRPGSELRRFSELAEGYFAQERKLALICQLIDIRHPCSKDDETMLRYMVEAGLPFVVVLTKADKCKPTELKKRLESIQTELNFIPDTVPMIPFSAIKGTGVEQLQSLILQYCDRVEQEGE